MALAFCACRSMHGLTASPKLAAAQIGLRAFAKLF
jgi:hypothetical protein